MCTYNGGECGGDGGGDVDNGNGGSTVSNNTHSYNKNENIFIIKKMFIWKKKKFRVCFSLYIDIECFY